jgi:hypothetical protein
MRFGLPPVEDEVIEHLDDIEAVVQPTRIFLSKTRKSRLPE